MNVSVMLIRPAAQLVLLRNEDRTLQESGSAPAALAGATAGGRFYAGALKSDQNRFVGQGVNHTFLCRLTYGDRKALSMCLHGIGIAFPRRFGDINELTAETSLWQAEFFNLWLQEAVHCLWAAEIY